MTYSPFAAARRSVSANLLRSATLKSGRATSMTMTPDLLLAGRDLGRREVSRRDVVVVPEAQMNGLAAREELPHLGREDPEVRPGVRRGLRAGVPGQDVEDARAELAVLVLLAPDARGQVHERREGAIGAAERPHAGELVGIDGRALADEADRRRRVAGLLDRRLQPRAERIRVGIVVSPQAAVLEVHRLRQVGGQRERAVLGDVVQPLDELGDRAARARRLRRTSGRARP